MGLSKALRFARGVWLVAAVVVCTGAFLCFLPTGLDVSTGLRPADSPPLDRGAEEGHLALAWGLLLLRVELRMGAHQLSEAGGIVLPDRPWSIVGQRL